MTVCSPRSLVETFRPKNYEFLQATLVVDRWDFDQLKHAVSDLCKQTSGPDWPSIAESLSRFMAWEYADHSA